MVVPVVLVVVVVENNRILVVVSVTGVFAVLVVVLNDTKT